MASEQSDPAMSPGSEAETTDVVIGRLAELSHVTASALRLYERSGLIAPRRRGANNYRYFDGAIVEWIRVITMMLSLGLSLSEIRTALAADGPIRERGTDADARVRMRGAVDAYRKHVAVLDAQIAGIAWRKELCLTRIAYCTAELASDAPVRVAHEDDLVRVRRPGHVEYRKPGGNA